VFCFISFPVIFYIIFSATFASCQGPADHEFETGMKLEAVNPQQPGQICVATIAGVLDNRLLKFYIDHQRSVPCGTRCQATSMLLRLFRVSIPSEKSWISPRFSTPWKVLKNKFGSGKSWKLKLMIFESPEKFKFWIADEFAGVRFKQYVALCIGLLSVCTELAAVVLFIQTLAGYEWVLEKRFNTPGKFWRSPGIFSQ